VVRSEAVALGVTQQLAGARQSGKSFVEGGVAHPTEPAQLRKRHGAGGGFERLRDTLIDGLRLRRGFGGGGTQLQRESLAALGELEADGWERGGGAMLDGEGEIVIGAAHVQVRVAPGVELGGAAQCLPAFLLSELKAWRLTDYLNACAAAGNRAPADLRPYLPWSMDAARLAQMRRAPSQNTHPLAQPPVDSS